MITEIKKKDLQQPRRRFPDWLKKPRHDASANHDGSGQHDGSDAHTGSRYSSVAACVAGNNVHTVCTEARCPNRAECFSAGTATFLILGNTCTRSCGYCGVRHGNPLPLDPDEPARVAASVKALRLRHIVITSVTRDDLPDGGAGHFARTVRECRKTMHHKGTMDNMPAAAATIEVLIPDFNGDRNALDTVLDAGPDILNHNVETVLRLYPAIRPQADYRQSLGLLAYARLHGFTAKSGLMVGLGESDNEVCGVLEDLHNAGCRMVTIGQYLQPSREQVPVQRFVPPEQFERYEKKGKEIGLHSVFAGPFVRSSYKAGEVLGRAAGA
jgi:lipoyl synthase